jgi:hypothetical protein
VSSYSAQINKDGVIVSWYLYHGEMMIRDSSEVGADVCSSLRPKYLSSVLCPHKESFGNFENFNKTTEEYSGLRTVRCGMYR